MSDQNLFYTNAYLLELVFYDDVVHKFKKIISSTDMINLISFEK